MNEALPEATRITGAQAAAVLEHDEARTVRAAVGPWRQSDEGVAGQIDSRDGRWGELRLASSQKSPLGRADEDFVQALANVLAEAIRQRPTEDGIRYLSVHDPLTGLPNRVLFLERLADTLSGRAGGVAVALLDIDNFKLINDSLGHAAGDDLLTKIAPRLKSALRSQDLVARFGGDEFVGSAAAIGTLLAAGGALTHVCSAPEAPAPAVGAEE